jgi:hypothetical protein
VDRRQLGVADLGGDCSVKDAAGNDPSPGTVANAISREKAHRELLQASKCGGSRRQEAREDERGSAPVFKPLGKKGE